MRDWSKLNLHKSYAIWALPKERDGRGVAGRAKVVKQRGVYPLLRLSFRLLDGIGMKRQQNFRTSEESYSSLDKFESLTSRHT